MSGRYIGRYEDYNSKTREIGNFWLCDLNIRYTISDLVGEGNPRFKGSYITLGAVNVLDKSPQYANYLNSSFGYDPAQADIRGRFVYTQISVKF